MDHPDPNFPSNLRVWRGEDAGDERENGSVSPDTLSPRPAQQRWERELDLITGNGPKKTRTVPISLLTELLVDAKEQNSQWLDDFAGDVVTIDADLHDVLLAYQKYRRQSLAGKTAGDGQAGDGRQNVAA